MTNHKSGNTVELTMKPLVMEKPWGQFSQYTLNEPVTVKIIEVKKGQQLSLQSHQNRAELWIPLDAGAEVQINEQIIHPEPMEQLFIPCGAKHRLTARDKGFRILEISFGEFDEDDITRYDDSYGRGEGKT